MSTLGIGTTDEDLITLRESESLFRRSPESALAGGGLLSIESQSCTTEPSLSSAVATLAAESPSRFLFLVALLPPVAQDILIQYYLLGRTYEQIRSVLFPSHASCEPVKIGNRLGIRALAAAASCDGILANLRPELAIIWSELQRWNPSSPSRSPLMRAARDLGDFVIHPNGQLSELFPTRWWRPSSLGSESTGC